MSNISKVYADKILTIAVLVILVTAPIGAIAILNSAPRLLSKEKKSEEKESAAWVILTNNNLNSF